MGGVDLADQMTKYYSSAKKKYLLDQKNIHFI
jgi:hypothetical protein